MSRYTYDDAELRPFGAAILRLLNSGEDDVAVARRLSMAATFDLTGRPQLKGNIPISILAEKTLKILGGRGRYRPEDVGRIRKYADELGLLNQTKSNPMKIIAEREYQTYAGWRKAAKEAGATRFEGDRDIAQAFNGDTYVGEWDGAVGVIFVYGGSRQNPTSKIRVGDEVIGIMGVDGGYAGTVTDVTRDSRGRVLVTYRDAETGEERTTFDFNLSKNVPARGTFPRRNPLRRRPGESERDFMARCMSAEKKKFPRQDQRVAVCLSKARRNPISLEDYEP